MPIGGIPGQRRSDSEEDDVGERVALESSERRARALLPLDFMAADLESLLEVLPRSSLPPTIRIRIGVAPPHDWPNLTARAVSSISVTTRAPYRRARGG